MFNTDCFLLLLENIIHSQSTPGHYLQPLAKFHGKNIRSESSKTSAEYLQCARHNPNSSELIFIILTKIL